MNGWIRGHSLFPETTAAPTDLWAEIEQLVERAHGCKSFDDLTLSKSVTDHYLQSRHRPPRPSLVDGPRYERRATIQENSNAIRLSLGPVELDLFDFINAPNPLFLALIGGMGAGKSTTIRFMEENFAKDRVFLICNFDENPVLQGSGEQDIPEDEVARELAGQLSRELVRLVPPDDEITKMWTWALNGSSKNHSAKNVLNQAQSKLADALGNNWLSETHDALALRREALAEIKKNASYEFYYQALRLDYYLSCVCNDDRSKFLLILDNADPLPPRIQTKIYTLASSFQLASRCKVLVSFRPHTYSSNCQGASRLIDVVEHSGAPVVDILKDLVDRRILKTDLSALSTRVRDSNGNFRTVRHTDVALWAGEILTTITSSKATGVRGDPNAQSFIEGICGRSIRSALVIAPKIFGSPATPLVPNTEETGQPFKVRDHDIIRCIVEGWKGYYCADRSGVIHNMFDLGLGSSRSSTCKIRLLMKLRSFPEGITTLAELIQHLSRFGYSDQIIRDTVNDVMVSSKPLAWSDSVHMYQTLEGHRNSRVQLSSAGEFYIEHAIYNLEYVQGVHVDVLLPVEETLQHDPRSFSSRLRSLELFLRFLHGQELREVCQMLISPLPEYVEVYGKQLFSLEIIHALSRQVKNVGNALLRNPRQGRERQDEISETLRRWDQMQATLRRMSQPVLDKIGALT